VRRHGVASRPAERAADHRLPRVPWPGRVAEDDTDGGCKLRPRPPGERVFGGGRWL